MAAARCVPVFSLPLKAKFRINTGHKHSLNLCTVRWIPYENVPEDFQQT